MAEKKTYPGSPDERIGRVAPRLFASDDHPDVPEAVRAQWQALVESDLASNASQLDLCILALQIIVRKQATSMEVISKELNSRVSQREAPSLDPYYIVSQLLKDELIEDVVVWDGTGWVAQEPRIFRATPAGRKLLN